MLSCSLSSQNYSWQFLCNENRTTKAVLMDDYELMDDPEFLAERRRVRAELETQPSAELTARYAALNDEFIRRAGAAWKEQ